MKQLIVWFLSVIYVSPVALGDVPRTPAGQPDLTGNYDSGSLTPEERPRIFGKNQFMTAKQAERMKTGLVSALQTAASRISDPNRSAPVKGGDGNNGAGAGGVGGYNSFWIDPGDHVLDIDGKFRTSIVYDPPNGRKPSMTAKGRFKTADNFSSFTHDNDGTASWLERDGPGPFDDPEELALAERCLLGFSAGPPMLPNGFYNNNYTIVQTPDHIMIMTEQVHDVRIIRMGEREPLPEHIRPWMGDSWGRWEGDVLVVETTNLPTAQLNKHGYIYPGGSEGMKVIERFTRADENTINYEFTVVDPGTYTAEWGGEVPMKALEGLIYEYACAEGNYALGNILRGARYQERMEAENQR